MIMRSIYFYILYACLFFGSIPLCVFAMTDAERTGRIDSLKSLLSRKPLPEEEIRILHALSLCYRDEPEERDYCIQLYQKTCRTDSVDLKEFAVFSLTRYYYNKNVMDSVVYWNEQMKNIAKERGSYSNRYFITCNMACQYLLWYDVNEEGANEALRLYHLAQKENNKVGIYSSCETMGVAYTVMGQDSIAIRYYQEGIQMVKSIHPLHYSIMQSMMESLLEAGLRLRRFALVKDCLSQYEKVTEDVVSGKYGGNKYPINRCRWLAICFWADYYTSLGNLDEAHRQLENATRYSLSVDDIYVKYRFHLSYVHYYKAKGELSMALQQMDEVLKLGDSTELFMLKGEILQLEGQNLEAAECYKLAIQKTKERADASFMRQMTQLAHLHDISQEVQAHSEEILKRKQWQLFVLLSCICFVVILLVIVTAYTVRMRRMGNKMRLERDRLVESENRLSIAKNKAEESDRLKSLFLANMSHEIRTPLNAIVGFSQLLCDPDESDLSGQDRRQFSELIVHNSDLLLNLINDILDVSKLEADSYNFKFEKYDINECCYTCLASVRHRVCPGVKLTANLPQAHFFLNTDKLRLEQILINLLTNAAKFTTQGEISLAYEIDMSKKYVLFSVTDTGCGIPVEKQRIIFNRFEKLDNYVQGTGLGLAICSLIVKQFGGTIEVDSSYTKGARFVFTHRL